MNLVAVVVVESVEAAESVAAVPPEFAERRQRLRRVPGRCRFPIAIGPLPRGAPGSRR